MNDKALSRISRANAKRFEAGRALLTEAQIEQTCTEYLAWDGWRALKTDPVSRREWGKGFGELGMADYLYIRYNLDWVIHEAVKLQAPQEFDGRDFARRPQFVELIWIEWKRKGGKTKLHQTAWHALERRRGALTLIAGVDFEASIEGFQAWYRASGLQRRAEKPTP